jgi:hypothetical protein
MYSEKYFNLVNEVRELWSEGKIDLNEEDTLMVESDLGKKVKIGKNYIYLDAPYVHETETEEDILAEAKHHGKNVNLGKPFRTPGGPKKFAVYVKTPGGGGGSAPSMSAGGASAPAAPSFNVVGASSTNQLAQTIGNQQQQPIKAYVVANDVTTQQSLDRNIISSASIG